MSSTTVSRSRAKTKPRSGEAKSSRARRRPPSSSGTSFACRPDALTSERPSAGFRAVAGRPADHHCVHRLLVSLLHQPSTAEFQAQLEDPNYDPSDRLLVKREGQLVGHVHVVKRRMHFAGQRIPVACLTDWAVSPEFRDGPASSVLLAAAQDKLTEEAITLGLLRTNRPEPFLERGWTLCFRHSYSSAPPRSILSHLREREIQPANPWLSEAAPLNIRWWRHVERAALLRHYEQHVQQAYGALERSDEYWRWLISRRGYDRIYVAIEGQDKLDLDDTLAPIVGYAVVKEAQIVELVTVPGHSRAAEQLLARACRDAMEQGLCEVQLHADPLDPLHAVFTAADGSQHYHEAESGEVCLLRVNHQAALLRHLSPSLQQRLKRSIGAPVCELGLLLDGRKHTLVVRPRSVKLVEGKAGRSYLACSSAEFAQLLLGHLDVAAAVQSGRIEASTRVAQETAAALFPQLPLWRPPWDELPA